MRLLRYDDPLARLPARVTVNGTSGVGKTTLAHRIADMLGLLSDPEHVVRYAWSTRHDAAARVDALRAERPELSVVRLASPRQVERWLRGPLEEARTACAGPFPPPPPQG